MLVLDDKRGRAAALAGVLVTTWLFDRAKRRTRAADGAAGTQAERPLSMFATLAMPAAGALIGVAAYALYPYVDMVAQSLQEKR